MPLAYSVLKTLCLQLHGSLHCMLDMQILDVWDLSPN